MNTGHDNPDVMYLEPNEYQPKSLSQKTFYRVCFIISSIVIIIIIIGFTVLILRL